MGVFPVPDMRTLSAASRITVPSSQYPSPRPFSASFVVRRPAWRADALLHEPVNTARAAIMQARPPDMTRQPTQPAVSRFTARRAGGGAAGLTGRAWVAVQGRGSARRDRGWQLGTDVTGQAWVGRPHPPRGRVMSRNDICVTAMRAHDESRRSRVTRGQVKAGL